MSLRGNEMTEAISEALKNNEIATPRPLIMGEGSQ